MARTLASQETAELHNVSQDYETPPKASLPGGDDQASIQVRDSLPTKGAHVDGTQTQHGLEIVKDSLELVDAIYKGGPVQSPAEDSWDELYDISPQAKAKLALKVLSNCKSRAQAAQDLETSYQPLSQGPRSQSPLGSDQRDELPARGSHIQILQPEQDTELLAPQQADHLPPQAPAITKGKVTHSSRDTGPRTPLPVTIAATKPSPAVMASQRPKVSASQLPASQISRRNDDAPTKSTSRAGKQKPAATQPTQQGRPLLNGTASKLGLTSNTTLDARASRGSIKTPSTAAPGSSTQKTAIQKLREKQALSGRSFAAASPVRSTHGTTAALRAEPQPASSVPTKSKAIAKKPPVTKPRTTQTKTAAATKPAKPAKDVEPKTIDAKKRVVKGTEDHDDDVNDPYAMDVSPDGRSATVFKGKANKKGIPASAKNAISQPVRATKTSTQPPSLTAPAWKADEKIRTSDSDRYGPSQKLRDIPQSTTRVTRARANGQRNQPAGTYRETDTGSEPEESSDELQDPESIQSKKVPFLAKPNRKSGDDSGKTHEDVPKKMNSHVPAPQRPPTVSADPQDAVRDDADVGLLAPTHPPIVASSTLNLHSGPKAQIGSTQQAAIVLSDRVQSSSEAELDGEEHMTVARPDRDIKLQSAQDPKTPAYFGSSPPQKKLSRTHAYDTVDEECIIDTTTRKPKIIAFDRSGPRNQGSARKSVTVAVTEGRDSIATRKIPLASDKSAGNDYSRFNRKHERSSVAPSVRSTRTDRSAAPGNVADDVTDALAGLLGKKISPAKPFHSQMRDRHDGRSGYRDGQSVSYPRDDDGHDNGFVPVENFEESRSIQPRQYAPIEVSKRPTNSQIAMMPPSTRARVDKQVPDPIVFQAPVVPTMTGNNVPPESPREIASRPQPSQPKVASKRAAPDTLAIMPIAKYRRTEPSTSQDSGQKIVKELPGVGKGVPNRNNARTLEQLEARVRPGISPQTYELQPTKSQVAKARADGHSHRRVNRHGSQSVDIYGSPVPAALDVPHHATVLETFSQQTHMSSEDEVVLGALTSHKQQIARVAKPTESPKPPRKLSINEKPMPSQPHTESQAAADMLRGRVIRQDLTTVRSSLEADPFTSSEEATAPGPKRRSTSGFVTQLMAGGASNAPSVPSLATTAKQARVAEEDEDPDHTLVEPSPPKQEDHRRQPFKPRKDEESNSDSSSDDSSICSEATLIEEHDMTVWRNALQPHQMNLFDELVGISHQLVCHIVDKETATLHLVSDYRRRGENLIEQMHLLHQANRLEHVESLRKRKRAADEELTRAANDLDKLMACAHDAGTGEPMSKKARLDVDALQQALEVYC